MNASRHLKHALLALGLLAAGGLGARWIVRSAPDPLGAELPGPRIVPVETVILAPQTIPRVLVATGTLEPAREVLLASEIGGRVVEVAPGLGDGVSVEQGDVLLRVDPASLQAETKVQETAVELGRASQQAAEVDLEGAERSLGILRARRDLLAQDEERWRGLVEAGRAEAARLDAAQGQRLGAEAALEEAVRGLAAVRSRIRAAKLEVRLAQERLERLRIELQKTAVVAPFTGTFSLGSVGVPAEGTILTPLAPFGVLLETSALRLVTEVHEDDLDALYLGSRAMAAPLSRPGRLFEGGISALGSRVDPLTRAVPVEASFAVEARGDQPEIPAGTFAKVELTGEPFEGALWVAESWITYRDGVAVVFVLENRESEAGPRALRRPVEFRSGLVQGGRIVTAGLAPGDEVITSSLSLLGDGAPVLPTSEPR